MDVEGLPQLLFDSFYHLSSAIVSGTPEVLSHAVRYILAGSGSNERIGDLIHVHKLGVRLKYRPTSCSTGSGAIHWTAGFRFVLVLDNQKNPLEPTPTWLDVFDSHHLLANYRWRQRQRFTILFDEIYDPPVPAVQFRISNIDQTTGTVSDHIEYGVNPTHDIIEIPFDPPLRYTFTDGTSLSETGHAVYMFTYSDEDAHMEKESYVVYSQ